MGKDEEEGREELRRMLDDDGVDFGDILAAVIEHCGEDRREEVDEVLRSLGEDMRGRRGYRAWARDRLEMRDSRRAADARRARDEPEPFPGRPRPGGTMDPIVEGEDRRRLAGDMAYDAARGESSPSGLFRLPRVLRHY
jgi:hypothetical protein